MAEAEFREEDNLKDNFTPLSGLPAFISNERSFVVLRFRFYRVVTRSSAYRYLPGKTFPEIKRTIFSKTFCNGSFMKKKRKEREE